MLFRQSCRFRISDVSCALAAETLQGNDPNGRPYRRQGTEQFQCLLCPERIGSAECLLLTNGHDLWGTTRSTLSGILSRCSREPTGSTGPMEFRTELGSDQTHDILSTLLTDTTGRQLLSYRLTREIYFGTAECWDTEIALTSLTDGSETIGDYIEITIWGRLEDSNEECEKAGRLIPGLRSIIAQGVRQDELRDWPQIAYQYQLARWAAIT